MDGTVLVADDDRTIRTVLTQALPRAGRKGHATSSPPTLGRARAGGPGLPQALPRAGCKVHATSSLVTLMRWVEEGKGDLVISDVMMPDGNGIEQLPRIGMARPGDR